MKKLLTATILATTMTSAYANIEIRPDDMGVNLRTGLFLCRCPRCEKVINIRVQTKLSKDKK